MGEASDAIEQHIRETRGELAVNIEALESRVRRAMDWRKQVGSRPFSTLAIAFAGGFFASLLVASHRKSRQTPQPQQSSARPVGKAKGALGMLQGAALTMASVELKRFLAKAMKDRLRQAQARTQGGAAPVTRTELDEQIRSSAA